MTSPARRALRRHVCTTAGAVGLLLGAAAGTEWLVAHAEAERVSSAVTTRVAAAAVRVLATEDLTRGLEDPSLVEERLDPFFATGMAVRVKVWRVEGERVRIVYSDDARSHGVSRAFSPDLAARLDAGEVVVEPVPADAEHRNDPTDGVWEGMVGFRDAVGAPMRLEVYVPMDTGAMVSRSLEVRLPVLLTIAAALVGALVPLSIVLARRVRAVEDERREAVSIGIDARRRERNDLARRLHDGIVQDLAGARMALEAVTTPGDSTEPVLRRVIAVLEEDGLLLRGILDEFVDVGITADDLARALEALAALSPSVQVGVARVEVDDEAARVLVLGAQELVRNALRHASADRIRVTLRRDGGDVQLVVEDDGVGMDAGRGAEPGHVGLDLVRLAVAESGGVMRLETYPGRGSRVEIRLPSRRGHSASRSEG